MLYILGLLHDRRIIFDLAFRLRIFHAKITQMTHISKCENTIRLILPISTNNILLQLFLRSFFLKFSLITTFPIFHRINILYPALSYFLFNLFKLSLYIFLFFFCSRLSNLWLLLGGLWICNWFLIFIITAFMIAFRFFLNDWLNLRWL